MHFSVLLGEAYFNQGFINISVVYQDQFGEHGSNLIVYLGNWGTNQIAARINRTANTNYTPRIMMGVRYQEWVQQYHIQTERLIVIINNTDFPNSMLL